MFGFWWMIRDASGKRYQHLLLTKDGRLGTRRDLRARFRSQRLWSTEKQRAYQRHKIIERIDGPTDFTWVLNHPSYVPRKTPVRMRWSTFNRLIRRLEKYSP